MASGLGTRFGGNKLMADFGGKPMIQWILDATTNLFARRVVVTRNEGVRELCQRLNIDCVFHDLPHRSDTVRLGLEQMPDSLDGCMFCLADQPYLTYSTLYRLAEAATCNPDNIWRLICEDTLGSPVWFPMSLVDELSHLPEGKGGNVVAKRHDSIVRTVSISNPLELQDIDTRELCDELRPLTYVYQTLLEYQQSGKKHLLITGSRGSGKTTLINKLLPLVSADSIPKITTWADPGKAVFFSDSISGIERKIGVYDSTISGSANKMLPLSDELKSCASVILNQLGSSASTFVSIDEIGYLECQCEEYCEALAELMSHKHLVAVVRQQNLPFLTRLLADKDSYVVDMDSYR